MRSSVLLACGLATAASAKPCPTMGNFPHPLTRENAEIVEGGGIVVAALPERDDGKPDPRGTVAQWRFGNKPAKVTHVAPGLDVVATSAAGTLVSKDGDAQVTVKYVPGATPVLPAPVATKLERDAPEHMKHPYVETVATLSADPPAAAIAIVAFDRAGKVARSWNTVVQNNREAHIYTSGGCAPLPEGTVDSQVGDEVVLAWLDASGRLSKLSAPIKVVKK
jgi:hypothetical protein